MELPGCAVDEPALPREGYRGSPSAAALQDVIPQAALLLSMTVYGECAMPTVRGWDTPGISNIGALTDGRIKLAFTGKDGQTRNIFIPADTIGALVSNLIGVNDATHKLTGLSQPLSGKFMLGVKHAAIVSDASGREYMVFRL
jgi:hypothetical protein